jgi:hypothetical protein
MFADHMRKHGETLEPWSRSASRRVRDGFRPEVYLKTRQPTRSRTVAERAPRRNPRPTGRFLMLPSLRRTAAMADQTNIHLPWASWSNRSDDLFVESVYSRRVVRESNP